MVSNMKKVIGETLTRWNYDTMEEEVTAPLEIIVEFTAEEYDLNLIIPVVNFIKNKAKDCILKVYEVPEYAEEKYLTAWVFVPKSKQWQAPIHEAYSRAKKIVTETKKNRKILADESRLQKYIEKGE